MFGRARPHKGELSLSGHGQLRDDAWELARFWINGERSYVMTALNKSWSPELVGSLLLESARTVAAAYAHTGAMSEAEAWTRILHGLDEERSRLTAAGDQDDQA